ncbi:MAG: hypothetical protein M0T80_11275, partial [Actinomycetota bacterium]|nr:hypothetical protein [Actinomycetota bacterium]
MTRVPVPVLEDPERPAAGVVAVRLHRQRRTAVALGAVLSVLVLAAALTGSAVPWVLAAAVAVLGVAYAATALRLRRLATEREMSLAFLRDTDFDWGRFEAELRAERVSVEPADEEPPPAVDLAEADLAR